MFGYDSISLKAATSSSSCMYECSKWALDVGFRKDCDPPVPGPSSREDSSGGPCRCTDVLNHCVDFYLLFFTVHLRSNCCDMPIP